ncbi:MAG TPA: hypothetical protein VN690_05985 [Terriglobales bacterium]|nr:hypothetical protein [Terriglobales bacterium]
MPIYAIHGIVPVVDRSAYVHPTAVLIGDVMVGAGCYVGPCASLRGDFGRLILEPGSNLQDTCVMHGFPGEDTVVAEGGHIGHGAVLHGCRIGRGAMVGMNAVVMDGAVVGERAIVAAMSFVKAAMEIPARHLAMGVPAKVVRELSERELAWKDEGTRAYQELARRSGESLIAAEALTTPEANRRRIPVEKFEPLYKLEDA